MGKDKSTSQSTQEQSGSTSYTPTAEETEFNKLQLGQAKDFDPIQRQLNTNAGNLINQLLLGQSNLPGFLSTLPGGIDSAVTDKLVQRSLRDVNAQLSASGAGTFMDSGAAQSIGARTAGDIRLGAEEFNIGNLLNLLNLAVGGQAQVQQPALATSSLLSQRLAGLRTVNSSGTSSSTGMTTGMNPFLKSFQTSLGQTLGAPKVSAGPFSFGG